MRPAILPSSVRIPVATIAHVPLPLVTDVPINTIFSLSPIGKEGFRSGSVDLPTGVDSPVRDASCVLRLKEEHNLPSAGAKTPAPHKNRRGAGGGRGEGLGGG